MRRRWSTSEDVKILWEYQYLREFGLNFCKKMLIWIVGACFGGEFGEIPSIFAVSSYFSMSNHTKLGIFAVREWFLRIALCD